MDQLIHPWWVSYWQMPPACRSASAPPSAASQPWAPQRSSSSTTSASPTCADTDTDGDGTTDALEYVHGTSHTDAAAEFDLGLIISTANAITLHLDTDNSQPRSYQLLSSSDLVNWTRDGLPVLVPGVSAGPWAPLQITRPNSPQRTFQKVLVQQPQVVIP